MASIQESASSRPQRGVKKQIRYSTKVDMTPMVDLGFLLITFFIFTASVSKPKAMDLKMPADSERPMPVAKSGALTILSSAGNHIFYYQGELLPDGSNFRSTTLKGIRDVIIQQKKEVLSHYTPDAACEAAAAGNAEKLDDCRQQKMFVVIRPDSTSDYHTVVDLLDEMTISHITRFALDKITPVESSLIRITEKK